MNHEEEIEKLKKSVSDLRWVVAGLFLGYIWIVMGW
jgi:hypothetical protein